MKFKINILSVIIQLSICFSGCNDFLEESSQDEVRPSTVDELMQLMVGEVFPMDNQTCVYLDLLTDDVDCNGDQGFDQFVLSVERARYIFAWEEDMYEQLEGMNGTTSWADFYARIMGCNTILGYLDRVEGSDLAKANLKGQALVFRAWCYFFLVNLYGQPYTKGDPNENLGVPLKLEMEVSDGFFERNTVAEVYSQIEKDLLEGAKLLENNKIEMSIYKASPLMANALLSRVYLYMGNWDKAIDYANVVLEEKSTLVSLAAGNKIYAWNNTDEIIWQYGDLREITAFFNTVGIYGLLAPFCVSSSLIDLYDVEDLRLNTNHFRGINKSTWQMYYMAGYKGDEKEGSTKGIRTAEMYLNRAEAYIQKYVKEGKEEYRKAALADMNTLREYRFETPYTKIEDRADIDISTPEKLYEFYKEERRREFDFEDHRWFDLRRMGMPKIEHKFPMGNNEIVTYTLEDNSPRYVLPIPKSAIQRNPYLVQNPR